MADKMKNLLRRTGLGKMSAREYQANLAGLNMFFGAVLGFVLAGTEKLTAWQFGTVLALLASAVITILYISSSRQKITYSILALFNAIVFPEFIDLILGGQDMVSDKIRPTLLIWTLLTIMVEIWSRDKESPQA